MDSCRREFVKLAGSGLAGATLAASVVNPVPAGAQSPSPPAAVTIGADVKAFGAVGDGRTLDSPAVNRAVEAAAAAGGGTVRFPSGNYLCHSIRLKSNVGLYLEQGAVIVAADPLPAGEHGGYDEPEADQPWERYQDYGHNHWHNSLIWGVDLHDISILGPGRIWGRGLSRANGASEHTTDRTQGMGNKSISLKNCHNVVLKDFQILEGGWFGILATGVDNLTIDGLMIDTNRDGIDIDCCHNVHISDCSVNSPWDDAIVLKSSYALGYSRSCENITIANCFLTGTYRLSTMLDGTWKKFGPGERGVGAGRIKLGTESNGGFKNTAISNCIFEGCQGLTLESEDGALREDLVITNLTMRDIKTAPIFIRLGARLRGPSESTKTGAIRRVMISNIISSNAASQLGCIITGIPGFPVENVKISNLYLEHRGGGTAQQANLIPAEKEAAYPEPNMFGAMPSQGFFLRHVKNVDVSDVQIVATSPDHRPSFVLSDVEGVEFFRIRTTEQAGVPKFVLNGVRDFGVSRTKGVKDTEIPDAKHETL